MHHSVGHTRITVAGHSGSLKEGSFLPFFSSVLTCSFFCNFSLEFSVRNINFMVHTKTSHIYRITQNSRRIYSQVLSLPAMAITQCQSPKIVIITENTVSLQGMILIGLSSYHLTCLVDNLIAVSNEESESAVIYENKLSGLQGYYANKAGTGTKRNKLYSTCLLCDTLLVESNRMLTCYSQ
jgi:hypothetical protein